MVFADVYRMGKSFERADRSVSSKWSICGGGGEGMEEGRVLVACEVRSQTCDKLLS
jgi:hypothetical protein